MPGIEIRVRSGLAEFRRDLHRVLDQVCAKTAADITADAKASMSGPKHGRVYVRANVAHAASAPGEAPAIDSSTLVNSIEPVRRAEMHHAVEVGAEHGVYLEYGTATMAARPFLGPAGQRQFAAFAAAVDQAATVARRRAEV